MKARGPTRLEDADQAAPSSAGDAAVAEAAEEIRQELEDKIATLEDRLAGVEEERDSAIAAAGRQEAEKSPRRRKGGDQENQRPDPTLKRWDRELSRVKARLHSKTMEARRYLSERNATVRQLRQARAQLASVGATPRAAKALRPAVGRAAPAALDKAQEHIKELTAQVRRITGELKTAQRQTAKLAKPSKKEEMLATQVSRLKRELAMVQSQAEESAGKVRRLKKRNAKLERKAADQGESQSLFGRAKRAIVKYFR